MGPTASGIQLTLLGHSCVLVSINHADGGLRRLLLDPGNLTPPVTDTGPVDAILVTHAHGDHVDPDQVRQVRRSGPAPVYGDEAVAAMLGDAGVEGVEVVGPDTSSIAGVPVAIATSAHELVYPGVPVPPNLTFLIAGTVFAPGDSFAVPEAAVDVLLLPTGAPWMKLAETIDYLRAVAPRVAIPVHDGGLADAHQKMHRALITKFAPDVTTVLAPAAGERIDLGTPVPAV